MDATQTHVMALEPVELNNPHGNHLRFLAGHPQDAVSHHISARVNPYYYLFKIPDTVNYNIVIIICYNPSI